MVDDSNEYNDLLLYQEGDHTNVLKLRKGTDKDEYVGNLAKLRGDEVVSKE